LLKVLICKLLFHVTCDYFGSMNSKLATRTEQVCSFSQFLS